MDTPTCPQCGCEDPGGARYCTRCGRRMFSAAGVRVRGWILMAAAAAGLTLTAWLFSLSFGSKDPPDLAQTAFLIIAYGTVAATGAVMGVAGVSQAIHGRLNRLSRWVYEWMSD